MSSPMGRQMVVPWAFLLAILLLGPRGAQAARLGTTQAHPPPAHLSVPSVYAVQPLVSLGLSVGALGLSALLEGAVRPALTSSLTCARTPEGFCRAAFLLALDRAALGRNSAAWQEVTDVAQILLPVVGVATLGLDALWRIAPAGVRLEAAGRNLLVALEAVSLATATTTVLKFAVRRPRPRQYAADPRVGVDGDLSFPSGHTTLAASVAVATATTLTLGHPQAAVRATAWTLAGAATLTMATGRVLSGRHFPTDVIAGALIGGIAGVVVPLVHRRPLYLAPELGAAGYVGLRLQSAPPPQTRADAACGATARACSGRAGRFRSSG